MPLSKLQFDYKITPATWANMREVLDYLRERPDLAFTADELSERLKVPSSDLPDALEELVLFFAVDERLVRGIAYYAYLADIEGLEPVATRAP